MNLLTVVSMPMQLFVVIILFSVCASFVAGCIWMASGKKNKQAEMTAYRGTYLDYDGVENEFE